MILVTGGTGFIGSHLVEYLLSQGREVKVLVRNPSKLKLDVDFAVRDITDKNSLRKVFKDIDEVYHLAALFRHGADPKEI